MSTPDRLAFGDFVLERSQQRVLRADGTVVVLTPRLFDALALFLQHPGKLLDKDTLMKALWPGLVVEENNLSQVVAGLRRALGDDRQGSRFIQTVPRRGFRFIATVTPLLEAGTSPAPANSVVASTPPAEAAISAVPAQAGAAVTVGGFGAGGRRSWLRLALATGAAAGLGATGWWAWHRASPAAAPPVITLAVLPLKPLAPEGRDALLEIGMADSLVTRLSTVPGLIVRSAGSVMRYAGPAQDPLQAARELDVDWIVDGSLQRSGENLRVTARLLRAADGTAAWSGSFDERFIGVFDLQDRISTKVMHALLPVLHAGAPARGPLVELGGTRSTEAYQLYLAAAWRAQGTHGHSTGKAVALLQQALSIDPGYALAWAMLAWVHRRRLWRNDARPSEVFESADAALRQALRLTPRLGQARAGLAFSLYWYDFDWPAAEREFGAALSADPNNSNAHWGLAQLLLTQGRFEDGFAHLRMARELDPMSPVANTLEASYLLANGQLDEARARLNRAFDIAPEHGLAYECLGMLRLAEGQPDSALTALRRSVDLSDGSTRPQAVLGAQLARLGQEAEARAILSRLHARARVQYLPHTHLAMVHAGLGEKAAALDALEQALLDRDARLTRLKDDASWDSLHREPRFAALVRQLRLDRYARGLAPI